MGRIVSRGEGGVERAVAGEVVETTTPVVEGDCEDAVEMEGLGRMISEGDRRCD